MIVYGVALLGFCMLVGVLLGDLLGKLIGVQANVGGVGIAMLLLMVLSSLKAERFQLGALSEQGIGFWSAMYIPIVVAMAAKQNVAAALDGGVMALLAGVLAVIVSFAMIPVLARFGEPMEDGPPKATAVSAGDAP